MNKNISRFFIEAVFLYLIYSGLDQSQFEFRFLTNGMTIFIRRI